MYVFRFIYQEDDDVFFQLSLGIPLSYEIAAIMPELKKAADVAIDILLGNDDYIALQGGE